MKSFYIFTGWASTSIELSLNLNIEHHLHFVAELDGQLFFTT